MICPWLLPLGCLYTVLLYYNLWSLRPLRFDSEVNVGFFYLHHILLLYHLIYRPSCNCQSLIQGFEGTCVRISKLKDQMKRRDLIGSLWQGEHILEVKTG